jgi:hypothetical protein
VTVSVRPRPADDDGDDFGHPAGGATPKTAAELRDKSRSAEM